MARIKWRTQASDKKLRKARTVTYSSKDRFPKTRATARRNRSKAKTWLLKDRGNARRSHARSRGKARKDQEPKQSRHSPCRAFPSHKCNLPKWCTLKALCATSFSKIKQVSPLFDHFSPKNSPPCWHMHTSSLKKCLNLPLKSCYAMNVVQRV